LNKKTPYWPQIPDPGSCVDFDPEPALACHGRDRPRKGHWRSSKKGIKTGEYSGIFSLNKPDFGLFWNDSEEMDENKRGFFGSGEFLFH
jgi:hypothetical protein